MFSPHPAERSSPVSDDWQDVAARNHSKFLSCDKRCMYMYTPICFVLFYIPWDIQCIKPEPDQVAGTVILQTIIKL